MVRTSKNSPVVFSEENLGAAVLRPLCKGKPVVLRVTSGLVLKKARIKDALLFMVPLPAFGIGDDNCRMITVSLLGGGCEIIDVDDLKLSALIRVGLKRKSAHILSSAIKQAYNLKGDGYDT